MRILLFSTSLFILISGCKKNNENTVCLVDQVQTYLNGTLNYTTNYEHDVQGRIKKIISPYGTKIYDYFSDSVVMIDGGERTVYYLGNNGLAASSKSGAILPDPSQLQLDYTYTYDAESYLIQEQCIFSQLYNGNILRDTTIINYTVSNGNIIKLSLTQYHLSNEELYEYSSSLMITSNQEINPFPSGRGVFFGKAPRNLVSGIRDQNGNILSMVSYTLGLGNKINEVTHIGVGPSAGTTKKLLHYQCN